MPEAVFIDRDGTIVEEVGYGSSFDETSLIPGAAGAIARLNERAIPVIVISNQAGVARGYFPESNIPRMHEGIARALRKSSAHVDAWYWCPHLPEGQVDEYAIDCDCRKPKPGMLKKAAHDLHLDLSNCAMIGDKASDIEAGERALCRTVLVLTGHGAEEWSSWKLPMKPSHVAPDLAGAVDWLIN
ncbi:MAG TPA: HAD family hydrolase [Candidatus Paceibacterota bacterium]